MKDIIKEIAENNSVKWLTSLKTLDPEKVAELYSEDSTFLPTVSGEFKKGKKGARDYFIHFLEKNPAGTIEEEELHVLSDKFYVHSGHYNFEIDSSSGREIVNARFTFCWRLSDEGNWEIIHHHSSAKPQPH
ncbi:SgcJ/EcaC family oxidoreductase [candidate division WOR-3 bacterium]|nr:SgcJ/EcaC family oxidoreductase [candidate division WOR-3 bacterium]